MRGALQVHPSFESGLASMRGFFMAIDANPPGPPAGAAKKLTDAAQAEAAAAVAAAVAAAGPVPQPAQQSAEVPAGRGAEGALGLWGGTTQRGQPPAGAAGAPGTLDAWLGKSLGQARMVQQQLGWQRQQQRQHAQAAAAPHWGPPALSMPPPAVKQEQVGDGGFLPQPRGHEQSLGSCAQQQYQQQPAPLKLESDQLTAGLLQQQQQAACVKGEPQQWVTRPQQEQEQQQQGTMPLHQSALQYHPAAGWCTRPGVAEQAPLGPAAAAQLQALLAKAPIEAWVQADVADCQSFLTKRGGLPV